MKTLYLDCGMGAAGDMLTAALLELLPEPDKFIEKINALGIPGVTVTKESAAKCGIRGTHISVRVHGTEEGEHNHTYTEIAENAQHSHESERNSKCSVQSEDSEHDHHHHEHVHIDTDENKQHAHSHEHNDLHGIEHILSHLSLPQKIKDDVLAVYGLIAEAESAAHGVPVTEIHFHEVGTMDAVADITAVCLLMDELSPDEVVVSPIHVGKGQVKCAHGILPVPAPATAYILKGVPMYSGEISGELCTPTGAALLKYFATRFGNMPVMKTQAIGYGMGKKDFPVANCVRAMLGETENKADTVLELSCNVDDMTAESIGFAMEQLFDGGALDVYTLPIGMKKSRPGTLIRVICKEQDKENMIALLFKHTTTIGIRENVMQRYVLTRKEETVMTPYGEIRKKVSAGYGVNREKYEYEDLSRIAKENNIGLAELLKQLENS